MTLVMMKMTELMSLSKIEDNFILRREETVKEYYLVILFIFNYVRAHAIGARVSLFLRVCKLREKD